MNTLPKHIAIIMDGNRRWARAHHLPVIAGHRKVVVEKVEELIDHAGRLGIPYVTFWAFSTENWGRPPVEVYGIMKLFRLALRKYAQRMIDRGAKLRVIGDMSRFDPDIREGIETYLKKSDNNDKITVTFALNYGGRDEIVRAVNKMMHNGVRELRGSGVKAEDVEKYLDTAGMPDPDLIIRTSGEQRLSGFLPWQSVYSEYYFTDTLMPDFGAAELDKALTEYARRERRRGK